MQAITEPEALKKQRRDIEKKMTVHVQQISATVEQVGGLAPCCFVWQPYQLGGGCAGWVLCNAGQCCCGHILVQASGNTVSRQLHCFWCRACSHLSKLYPGKAPSTAMGGRMHAERTLICKQRGFSSVSEPLLLLARFSVPALQVGRKVGDVYQLVSSQTDPLWRSYAIYMFAVKVCSSVCVHVCPPRQIPCGAATPSTCLPSRFVHQCACMCARACACLCLYTCGRAFQHTLSCICAGRCKD